MDALTLTAEQRTGTGRTAAMLREQSKVPGIVYGHGFAPLMVTLGLKELDLVANQAGESTLIDLAVTGQKQPVKVLIQEVQRDPLSGKITHMDFRAVRMDEKLKVEIQLEFVNEAPAVKNLAGTLVKNLEHIEVLCLPSALVHSIKVDIGVLKSFEDKIRMHDLKLPEGMEMTAKTDEVVVLVVPPRSDEEMASLDKAVEVDASKVEVVKKEKKEEGEAEEGAEAPAEKK